MKRAFVVGALVVAGTMPSWGVVCGDQDVAVEFYSPRVARVVKTPAGRTFGKPFVTLTAKPWAGSVAVEETETSVEWRGGELIVTLDKGEGTVAFKTKAGDPILAEKGRAALTKVSYNGKAAMRAKQGFGPGKDEGLYGLGDLQSGRLNQRGEHRTLTPGNVGDGIAYVASDRGWAVWWDNTSPTTFADKPGEVTSFESDVAEGVDYYFIWGGSGDGCVAEMRGLTGDVPLFPRWAYGFWQSRERYKTPEETLGVVRKYRELGIPLDGIVQDWQYWGDNYLWNAMEFTGEGWEGGPQMIKDVHDLNARIIITIWQSFGPQTKAYRELEPQGLLYPFRTWPVSGLGHIWPPREDYLSGVRLCDNFSPIVRDVYWKNLHRLWDAGIDGWWMDSTDPDHMYKEGDFEHPTAAGCTYRAVRNAYPISAVKGVYEHQRAETDSKRVFILTRGASAGQQAYAGLVWSGDIGSSWEVLRCQIPGGLNQTVTGNPLYNSDIGGFFAGRYGRDDAGAKNVNYRELYARWMQLGAFMPMMRSHGTEIWREFYYYGKAGEEAYDALVEAVKLRYRLMPTIYSLAGHMTKDRASFMRPVWFDYDDPAARDAADKFLLGDSILVTPILKALYTTEDNRPVGEYEGWDKKAEGSASGAASAELDLNACFLGKKSFTVALPKGTDWWLFANEKRYAGGTTETFDVTLRSNPFFVKAGGILVLGPDVQYNGEKDWRELDVNVYPGADGSFDLYEDAFETYAYEKGGWTEIPFVWNDAQRTLTIGARRGSYPEMLAKRVFRIHVPGVGDKVVSYDGRAVEVKF